MNFLPLPYLPSLPRGAARNGHFGSGGATVGPAWVWTPLMCAAGPNHALLQPQLRAKANIRLFVITKE